MPEESRTFAEQMLRALADGDNVVRESVAKEVKERFLLRSTFYYWFNDDSYLQVTQAFGTQVYLCTKARYDSRKVEKDLLEKRYNTKGVSSNA